MAVTTGMRFQTKLLPGTTWQWRSWKRKVLEADEDVSSWQASLAFEFVLGALRIY